MALAGVLGLASYPLYLIHQEAGYLIIGELIDTGVPHFLSIAICILTVISVSICISIW